MRDWGEAMRTVVSQFVVAAALLGSTSAVAQVTKTVTGETQTVTATVEAIDQARREITLKKDDGTYEVLGVPKSITRFSSIKVGDTIKVRYYENIVFRLKPASEPDVDSANGGVVPSAGSHPSGTMSGQRTITAKITAIDPKVPSISFTGPNGWAYSAR